MKCNLRPLPFPSPIGHLLSQGTAYNKGALAQLCPFPLASVAGVVRTTLAVTCVGIFKPPSCLGHCVSEHIEMPGA